MRKGVYFLALLLVFCGLLALSFSCKGSENESNGINNNSSQTESFENGNDSTKESSTHTHAFTVKKAEEKYLHSEATCEKKAEYYFSCECGAIGTETFEYGKLASNGLEYNIQPDNTTCSVISIGTCNDTDLLIPAISPDGYVVTAIDKAAFKNCNQLITVVIPSRVTYIGENAFLGCNSIISLTLPFIGEYLNQPDNATITHIFGYTPQNLHKIIISSISGLTSIGDDAFNGCSGLKNICIPDTISYVGLRAFDNCTELEFNEFDNALYLGNADNPYLIFIRTCNKDSNVFNINDKTSIVYYNAFSGCCNLTSIIIPSKIVSISESLFRSYPNLITYYCGTPYQWKELTKNIDYNIPYDAILYFSDTKPTKTDYYHWRYVDGKPTKWIVNGVLVLYSSEISHYLYSEPDNQVDYQYIYDNNAINYDFNILCNYDQIILDGISNYDLQNSNLPKNFDLILKKYVSEYGGDLLTIGSGNNSYNQSDMKNSIYEDLLPIKTNCENKYGNAVVVLIDRSGSMSSISADGQNAYRHAINGAGKCLNALNERNYFGIITFDDSPQRVLDLTPVTQKSVIYDTLQNKMPGLGGGTVFTGGIKAACEMLSENKNIIKRHIIMVTDGQITSNEVTDCEKILRSYYNSNKITLSIMCIGSEASNSENVKSFQYLIDTAGGLQSGITGGRKVHTYNSSNITSLYREMCEEITAVDFKNIEHTVAIIENQLCNLTDGLQKKLNIPYYIVDVKSQDYVYLSCENGAPLYAEWQYGKGTVGCLMSESKGKNNRILISNIIKRLKKDSTT